MIRPQRLIVDSMALAVSFFPPASSARRVPVGTSRTNLALRRSSLPLMLSLLLGWATPQPARCAGWAVGTGGTILKSTDAGASWSKYPLSLGDGFRALYFVDDNTGWAVGTGGIIYKTTDGGISWNPQNSNVGAILNGVYFVSSSTGWVVGTTGTILKTTNGGTNWTAQNSGSGETLLDVFFVDASTGWAVGTTGTILKTTNGGTTWGPPQSSGTNTALNAVYFVDSSTGCAAGGSSAGTILKTTDGGAHWTAPINNSGPILFDVFFVNPSTGWAVGGSGTGAILKTNDGGTTWNPQTSGTTATLRRVFFLDPSNGWTVGGSSTATILATTNGGLNWTPQTPPSASGLLYGVQFKSIPSNVSITVNTSPPGLQFYVDGISYSSTQVFSWVPGSMHSLNTTSAQSGTGTQYSWFSWSDGGLQAHSVAPTTSTTYTANFNTKYLLTMNAGSGGSVSPGGYKDAGTVVPINATPSSGFFFAGWNGNGAGSYSGSNNPASVTMNGPITETASFTTSATFDVTTDPYGIGYSVDGMQQFGSVRFTTVLGSTHTIATTSPAGNNGSRQYVWSSWSDSGAISHTITANNTVPGAVTYTARFVTQYMLTMIAGSGGTVSPGSGFRDAGSTVTISAAPAAGNAFAGWKGSGTGSYTGPSSPASATMSAAIAETASFVTGVSVTVTTNPLGRSFSVDGVSYSSAQAFAWVPGSFHTIASTSPQAGATGSQYLWSSWSDGGAMSHLVAPTVSTTYTANFTTQYFLTMTAANGGTVGPASGFYDAGSVVTIQATPDAGNSFAGWIGTASQPGGYSGRQNPDTLRMAEPVTESACFVPGAPPPLPAMNLSWSNCSSVGTAVRTFACNSNSGGDTLIVTFVPSCISSFTGIEMSLTVQSESDSLPPWWRLKPTSQGGCGRSLISSVDFSAGPSSCTNPWTPTAVAVNFVDLYPDSVPNRVRFRVTAVVPAGQEPHLNAGTEYYGVKLVMNHQSTIGLGACAGCSVPVCIRLDFVNVIQPGQTAPVTIFDPLLTRVAAWQQQGCADSTFFPNIQGVSPPSGMAGDVVTVNGAYFTRFDPATFSLHQNPPPLSVAFNGVNAPGYAISSTKRQLTVRVPTEASSGAVAISNAYGTGLSKSPFVIGTTSVVTSGDGGQPRLILRTNPAVRRVSMQLRVPAPGRLDVSVFDMRGARIRTIFSGVAEPGEKNLEWDGADRLGRPAASGLYFVRMHASGIEVARRVILLR